MSVDNILQINGTLIWYYYICKREVWLISHAIEADQGNELLEIGRIIHESTYKRSRKEISIGNIKVDMIGKQGEKIVIGEIKKTSRFTDSARMQLAFYLLELENRGIEAIGYLNFPKEKKKLKIELDKETRRELEEAEEGIREIYSLKKPPVPVKNKYCRKCAYQEFCWA